MRTIIIFITIIFIATSLYADTIILKNKTRVKGLVVEEYADRIVLSTSEGEKDIFRNDIDNIEYDTAEQNFMRLGKYYEEKGWYDKASFYYKKAMEANPDYKEARDAYLTSHARIWRDEEKRVKKDISLHTMAMEWQRSKNKKTVLSPISKEKLLKETIGISLSEKDGIFKIDEVVPGSSAAKSGIAKGDFLVGIWGRLIRHSKPEYVMNELLGPRYSEVKVLIEKEILVPVGAGKNLYKELGISTGFEYEGLVIKDIVSGKKAELSGLKKRDFIIAIDRNITRYLPMDKVIGLINSPKSNNIIFTVRRSLILRRESE
jgi:C-terminal processing protease CtpA/Prc